MMRHCRQFHAALSAASSAPVRMVRCCVFALLLSAFLSTAFLPSAAAQGPPPGYGAHWSISYTYNGATQYSFAGMSSASGSVSPPPQYFGVGGSGYTDAFSKDQITAAATLRWVDYQGNPAPNPPSKVYVLQSSQAHWKAHGATRSGAADDGLGDIEMPEDAGGGSCGVHYRELDSSSGVVTLTCAITATATAHDNWSADAAVDWSYSVTLTSIHAHPCNFRPTTAMDKGWGEMAVEYKWDSTSGSLADLYQCYLYEYVTYDGNEGTYGSENGVNYYYPPNPPFPDWKFRNPTDSRTAGGNGLIDATSGMNIDQHLLGNYDRFTGLTNFTSMSWQKTFTASQVYRYHCNVCGADENVPGNSGPFSIVRTLRPMQVYEWCHQADRIWRYSLTKHGITVWMDMNSYGFVDDSKHTGFGPPGW